MPAQHIHDVIRDAGNAEISAGSSGCPDPNTVHSSGCFRLQLARVFGGPENLFDRLGEALTAITMFTRFTTGDGRTLSYIRRGAGPLVVCVPGGPGMDPLAYFAPVELPGYEMLIFAPRGTGESSAPGSPEGYRIAGYLDDLECLRIHLGLDRVTLYGNSYGGSVVFAYACEHPQHVERLVISNAVARVDAQYETAVNDARRRFSDTMPDAAARLAAADRSESVPEAELSPLEALRAYRTQMACSVAREGPAETAYLDRLCSAPSNREAVAGMWAEWEQGLDLLERAGSLAAPALVIGSEADIVCPPAMVKLIADSLPNSRYVEIAGAGHFVAIEASDRFYAVLTDFLSP